ncbi:MAG: ATP-binding protein [Desulfobacterales bacterium]|nr:ATP-binding protein [Desulfobacterales bacterium]
MLSAVLFILNAFGGICLADVNIFEDTRGEIPLQTRIEILKDDTGLLTIADVTSPDVSGRFSGNAEGLNTFGYSTAVIWIRISLAKDQKNPESWYIQQKYPHLDQIDFFGPGKQGPLTLISAGDTLPFSHRPVAHRSFVFPVSPAETGTTYYLRLSSQGAITFPLFLIDESSFHRKDRNGQLLAGLYFGALLIMVAYNLLFLVFVRERLYLFYACFVLMVTLHQLIWFGFGFEFLWPQWPELNNSLDIFAGSGLFFFLGLFAMDFLRTHRHIPKVHLVLKFWTFLVGLSAVLVFFLDRQLILGPFNNLSIVQMFILLVAGIFCFFKRVRQGYIFLLAWTMAIVGGLSLALHKANMLPEAVVWDYSVQIGILVNVLLISLGLADRINNIKNSLTKTREKLEQKNEALKLSFSQLEMSEKRFRDLAELLPQTVFELDLDGRVIYANEQGVRLTGYSKADFSRGMNVLTMVDKNDHDRIRRDMEKVCAANQTIQGEYGMVRKDGAVLPVFFYASPIWSEQGAVGVRGVVLDLSERKKTEELMIQTEKMMSVGGLAAGMAHEINNPLAGMIQSAQVLQNRLTKDLPANEKAADQLGIAMSSIREYMEKRGVGRLIENINQSGIRASKIIQNMLTFAKKGDTVKRPCLLNKILDDTVDLARNDYNLKKKFDFREIRIDKAYATDLPPVFCEKSKIQQVVFNLLKNASEAMAEYDLGVSPVIELRLFKAFNHAVIEVADNGPGMTDDVRKKVFEPFFTTKGLERGTGLGLSVSYFIIVDDHGGEMKVASVPGQGTTFTIKLPLTDQGTTPVNGRVPA